MHAGSTASASPPTTTAPARGGWADGIRQFHSGRYRMPPLHPRRRTAPPVLGARGAGTRRDAPATRRARRPSRAVPASAAESPSCPRPRCSGAQSTVGGPNKELLPTSPPAASSRQNSSVRRGKVDEEVVEQWRADRGYPRAWRPGAGRFGAPTPVRPEPAPTTRRSRRRSRHRARCRAPQLRPAKSPPRHHRNRHPRASIP